MADKALLSGSEYEKLRKDYADFRLQLRQILADFSISSNPAVSDDWIVSQLRQLALVGNKLRK